MRVMRRVAPGSSKGRTTGFGPVNGGSNPPPGTIVVMRTEFSILLIFVLGFSSSCQKGDATEGASSPNELAPPALDCNHDLASSGLAKHSWPYPIDHRDLRWTGKYEKVKLKLKPTHAAFVTATLSFRAGDLIEVLDSEVMITKPRRLLAKRDLSVKRKVMSQGIEVEREFFIAKAGEPVSFLFYNSRGHCMVDTDDGPAWIPCTLDDTFEGLSAERPFACEQQWWIQTQRSRADKGWMVVRPDRVERVGPPLDATK